MRVRSRLLVVSGVVSSVWFAATPALADEIATPCGPAPLYCAVAPAVFSKEVILPVQGGFDTGWVPQGSALQVHLVAMLSASTSVDMSGKLVTSWPDPLKLQAPGDPGGGAMAMHYGVEVAAEAMVQVTVLGQNFSWTGPIPYVPQFDFQVDVADEFDPWAFDGVSVDGSTMEATLAQVDVTDFIGVNIPGLSGGFELNVVADLTGTYQTDEIRVTEDGILAASVTKAEPAPIAEFAGGASVDYEVQPIGSIQYDGVLHLIPAFYIDTIGPSWSIPIADIPIPFSFSQKDWSFDPVAIHVPLPDVRLAGDPAGDAPAEGEPVIDFGELEVGSTATESVDVENAGEAQLAGDLLGSSASLALPAQIDVGAGATGSFQVTLTANTAGPIEETITITTNDPDEPVRTIRVTANGVEVIDDDDGPATGPDDGCDCRASTSGGTAPWQIALAALGLVGLLRRRR